MECGDEVTALDFSGAGGRGATFGPLTLPSPGGGGPFAAPLALALVREVPTPLTPGGEPRAART